MQASISPSDFQQILLEWAAHHGRHDLPWQLNASPYAVLTSEIMLQQTQVITVIPYFQRWMEAFPDIQALADAEEDQVMQLWQGLGYYSRARNLQKAARYIVEECGGEFPDSLEGLQAIPGVGRYTAGAIRSFAFDHYGPIVDGNVRRLFCRLFGIEGQATSSAVQKKLWQLAHDYTPKEHNRKFAQGLLDMGATLCTPKKPGCERCPMQSHCVALKTDRVALLPTPKPKKVLPVKTASFGWLEQDQKLWLEKRPDSGIWSGLWCLPELAAEEVRETDKPIGRFKHTFSHYKLEASVEALTKAGTAGEWVPFEQIDQFGLPTPIRKFIQGRLARR